MQGEVHALNVAWDIHSASLRSHMNTPKVLWIAKEMVHARPPVTKPRGKRQGFNLHGIGPWAKKLGITPPGKEGTIIEMGSLEGHSASHGSHKLSFHDKACGDLGRRWNRVNGWSPKDRVSSECTHQGGRFLTHWCKPAAHFLSETRVQQLE